MKILIIGGHGTIGKVLVEHFSSFAEVVVAGRSRGDYKLDISDSSSIKAMFKLLGKVDAIICAAGEARWDNFNELSEEGYYIGIRSKLMGQVNIVRLGRPYLNKGGSITLSTGMLADDPVIKTSSAAMVNGALHSFVKAVDLEMENGIRVNAISLGLVEDAYERYKDYFPGFNAIPMKKVINAYARSVQGRASGQVIRYYDDGKSYA